jgi:hypothetical protein
MDSFGTCLIGSGHNIADRVAVAGLACRQGLSLWYCQIRSGGRGGFRHDRQSWGKLWPDSRHVR